MTIAADQLEGNIDTGSIIVVEQQSAQVMSGGDNESSSSSSDYSRSQKSAAALSTEKAAMMSRRAKDLKVEMLGLIKEETTDAEKTGADPRKHAKNLTHQTRYTAQSGADDEILKDSSIGSRESPQNNSQSQ